MISALLCDLFCVEVTGVKGESPLLLIPKTLTKDDRDDKWGMGWATVVQTTPPILPLLSTTSSTALSLSLPSPRGQPMNETYPMNTKLKDRQDNDGVVLVQRKRKGIVPLPWLRRARPVTFTWTSLLEGRGGNRQEVITRWRRLTSATADCKSVQKGRAEKLWVRVKIISLSIWLLRPVLVGEVLMVGLVWIWKSHHQSLLVYGLNTQGTPRTEDN